MTPSIAIQEIVVFEEEILTLIQDLFSTNPIATLLSAKHHKQ